MLVSYWAKHTPVITFTRGSNTSDISRAPVHHATSREWQSKAGGEQADARAARAAHAGITRGVTLFPKAALEKAPQMGDEEKKTE